MLFERDVTTENAQRFADTVTRDASANGKDFTGKIEKGIANFTRIVAEIHRQLAPLGPCRRDEVSDLRGLTLAKIIGKDAVLKELLDVTDSLVTRPLKFLKRQLRAAISFI